MTTQKQECEKLIKEVEELRAALGEMHEESLREEESEVELDENGDPTEAQQKRWWGADMAGTLSASARRAEAAAAKIKKFYNSNPDSYSMSEAETQVLMNELSRVAFKILKVNRKLAGDLHW